MKNWLKTQQFFQNSRPNLSKNSRFRKVHYLLLPKKRRKKNPALGFANNSGSGGIPANTLDEPVKETILRDVRAVAVKFKHVLYPKERKSLLRVSRVIFQLIAALNVTMSGFFVGLGPLGPSDTVHVYGHHSPESRGSWKPRYGRRRWPRVRRGLCHSLAW